LIVELRYDGAQHSGGVTNAHHLRLTIIIGFVAGITAKLLGS
jgi:hypothetical protein